MNVSFSGREREKNHCACASNIEQKMPKFIESTTINWKIVGLKSVLLTFHFDVNSVEHMNIDINCVYLKCVVCSYFNSVDRIEHFTFCMI